MKTNLDKFFKVDDNHAKEGVVFAINDKTNFRLRFMGAQNPKFTESLARHYKPYARQIDLGTLDKVKSDEIMLKVFVDACLVTWSGLEVDGEEIPYSFDNAIKVLTALPTLAETLLKHSSDLTHYREDDEALGNS